MIASISDEGAELLLGDGAKINIPAEDVEWAKTYVRGGEQTGLRAGDVVLAEVSRQALSPEESTPTREGTAADDDQTSVPVEPIMVPVGQAQLKQIPELEGAIVALDPHTGRVLAMMGGYSFFKSPFNRVTQARRQPGSSFKPLFMVQRWSKATPHRSASWTRLTFIMTRTQTKSGSRKTMPKAKVMAKSRCAWRWKSPTTR